MTALDYDALYELWISTPGMGLNSHDDTPEGISRYLNRNPDTCFVAQQNAQIVGVIMSGHDGRRGFIYHMAVKVAARKAGIGHALLEHALEALKAEGIGKVGLVAYAKNDIGNNFWEKHGFSARADLTYRDKELVAQTRMDVGTQQ
jgi:ribosomal protein S18 acetylase RimI-like enzyme